MKLICQITEDEVIAEFLKAKLTQVDSQKASLWLFMDKAKQSFISLKLLYLKDTQD